MSLDLEFGAFEEEVPHQRVSSPFEIAKASFELAFKDTTGQRLYRMANTYEKSDNGEMIDPVELNKEYQFEKPIAEPMTREQFDYLKENDMERQALSQIIQRGKGGAMETALNVGSSIAANLFDPVDLALSVGTGWGIARLAGKGVLGAKAAMAAKSAVGGYKAGLGVRIAEGVGTNLATEMTVGVASTVMEQRDLQTDEMLTNSVVGGLAFPVAISALGYSAKQMGKLFDGMAGRFSADKNALPSIEEVELFTNKISDDLNIKEQSLIAEQKSLLERYNKGEEALAPEINNKMEELATVKSAKAEVEAVKNDHVRLREDANKPDQNIGYDPEAQKIVDLLEKEDLPPTPIKNMIDEEYDMMIESEPDLEIKEALKNEKKQFEDIRTQTAQSMDFMANCVRGG